LHVTTLQPLCPVTAATTGAAGASYIALTGDLPGALLAFKTHYPILAIPVKAAVAFPLIYHYLGGLRHFAWDLHKIGNNAGGWYFVPLQVESAAVTADYESSVLH
jgi:succinate dehydrogenase (ubiquinone) cytochrome b560 subunit